MIWRLPKNLFFNVKSELNLNSTSLSRVHKLNLNFLDNTIKNDDGWHIKDGLITL